MRHRKRKHNDFLAYLPLIIIIGLLGGFSLIMFFRLNTIPGIFIDEANYMNEVISKANFGTDIQGLRHPAYFASVWGQGQSILYSLLAVPLVRIFGFSVIIFRLPMLFLTLLTMILSVVFIIRVTKQKWLAMYVCIALITSPWFFISGRWVLDANISPLFVMFGLLALIMLTQTKISWQRSIWLGLSAIFMGLALYGYIASWIYLPFLLVIVLLFLWKKELISIQPALIYLISIGAIALPLIVFAYRVNIAHVTEVTKFLWFDLPALPGNRVESLISFDGNVIRNMLSNLSNGISMFVSGGDDLPWNSVKPFGAIMPWLLIFAPLGMLPNRELSPQAVTFRSLLELSIVTFIPAMLIVTPNYNHWNFLMFPLSILVGFGLYITAMSLSKFSAKLLLAAIPLILFFWFLTGSYFGNAAHPTFFATQQMQYSEVKAINKLMEEKFRSNHLFVESLGTTFAYFRLVQKPINYEEYLKRQSAQQSSINSAIAIPSQQYGYLRDLSQADAAAKKGDLALIPADDSRFSDDRWPVRYSVHYSGADYVLRQRL